MWLEVALFIGLLLQPSSIILHLQATSSLPSYVWAFGLLPCLGYCEQCCNEHYSAYILEIWISSLSLLVLLICAPVCLFKCFHIYNHTYDITVSLIITHSEIIITHLALCCCC